MNLTREAAQEKHKTKILYFIHIASLAVLYGGKFSIKERKSSAAKL